MVTSSLVPRRRCSWLVPVDVPAEVAGGGFVNGRGDLGEIRGNVMLESVLADVTQEFLQVGNANHAGAPESLERIVSEFPFSDVTTDFPLPIIRRKTYKAHRAGFHLADTGSKGIFLADRAGDDLLKIHANVFEEVLRQIAAVKANRLVRVIGVVVIPIQQRTGSL